MIYNVTIDGTVFRVDVTLDREARQLAVPAWTGAKSRLMRCWRSLMCLSLLIAGKAYQIRRERIASDLRIWVGDQSLFRRSA